MGAEHRLSFGKPERKGPPGILRKRLKDSI
jgi:hypothetical protein